jgi:hypothetical protein
LKSEVCSKRLIMMKESENCYAASGTESTNLHKRKRENIGSEVGLFYELGPSPMKEKFR